MCQTTCGTEKTIAIELLLLEFSLIIYTSDVVFFLLKQKEKKKINKKLEFFRDIKSKFIAIQMIRNLKYF